MSLNSLLFVDPGCTTLGTKTGNFFNFCQFLMCFLGQKVHFLLFKVQKTGVFAIF